MQFTVMFAQFPGGLRTLPFAPDWITETIIKCRDNPHIGKNNIISWKKSDTPIYMVRNEAVLLAKKQSADYLLMIDSDMEADCALGKDQHAKPFWESSWEFMMAHRDEPCAIAAPYGGGGHSENAFEFQWTTINNNTDRRASLNQFTREQTAIMGGISEVAALPTGLILYDMRVFHEDLVPWFDYEHDPYKTKKYSTEDVYQTRNQSLAWYMSGGKIGGKCYCNWDAWAGHWKEHRVEKPMLMPISAIGEQLKKAVLGKHETEEQLMFMPAKRNSWITGNGEPKHIVDPQDTLKP